MTDELVELRWQSAHQPDARFAPAAFLGMSPRGYGRSGPTTRSWCSPAATSRTRRAPSSLSPRSNSSSKRAGTFGPGRAEARPDPRRSRWSRRSASGHLAEHEDAARVCLLIAAVRDAHDHGVDGPLQRGLVARARREARDEVRLGARLVGVPLGLEPCPAIVVKRALRLLSAFALTACATFVPRCLARNRGTGDPHGGGAAHAHKGRGFSDARRIRARTSVPPRAACSDRSRRAPDARLRP